MNEQNNNQNTTNNDIPVVDPKTLNEQVANQTVTTNPTPTAVPPVQPAQTQNVQSPVLPQNPELSVVSPQETVITPVQGSVINTEKKTTSNILFFVIIIFLGLCIFFIDDIMRIFNENITPYINKNTNNNKSGNLVDGYMKIEESSYMIIENVKFYNFKKSSDTILIMNYVSDKSVNKPEELEIFIEIYTSDKELLYKELFNPGAKLEKDAIKQYSMNVANDVYQGAFYALIKVYTKEEKESTSVLTCTYSTTASDDFKLTYTIKYNFINNGLVSYEVDKSYTSTAENETVLRFKEEIKNEYLSINDYNIVSNYTDTSLKYNINLSALPEGFSPLYKKDLTPKIVGYKESLKKWTCK